MSVGIKGVFGRSRRDFSIEKCAIGGGIVKNYPVGNVVSINLTNDSNNGAALAIYGIMAYVTSTDQTLYAQMLKATVSGTTLVKSMVKPDVPMIGGTLKSSVPALGGTATAHAIFQGSGNWLVGCGEAPLFILPVGFVLAVGIIIGGAALQATLLWAEY